MSNPVDRDAAHCDDTSKERIHRELRRAIIMGHLGPGERLSVNELAARYGISITPIRDALQMLGQEGLVTIRPRSGYFVTSITLKQLRDLLGLREILEIAAVERAAARITETELDELAHVHGDYTGDDDESYDRYTDENRRFHHLVAIASANQELAAELTRVHDRLARFMVMRHAGATQPHTHARIQEALRAHDVAAARQAMLQEINETRDVLLDRVMQEEGSYWALGTHV
jgi:DNA-binding GntR family transcriptional regulator